MMITREREDDVEFPHYVASISFKDSLRVMEEETRLIQQNLREWERGQQFMRDVVRRQASVDRKAPRV